MAGKGKTKRKTKRRKAKLTARTADRHALYEKAVQCVEADIDFAERVFRKHHRRRPETLREDFCGTAAAAVEFTSRRKKNRAWGVDLDAEVLGWGRRFNLPKLKDREGDCVLIEGDVLDVETQPADVLLAMNFSYFLFKTRAALGAYFAAARRNLAPGGLMLLDAYGGFEAQQPQAEKKPCGGFTYVWEQAAYNPVSGEVLNHIHFHFPDKTKLKKAFSYDWRLWTLPEIRELLVENGFAFADVYWEGWDDDAEEGDGVFRKTERAENCASWIAYIVAGA